MKQKLHFDFENLNFFLHRGVLHWLKIIKSWKKKCLKLFYLFFYEFLSFTAVSRLLLINWSQRTKTQKMSLVLKYKAHNLTINRVVRPFKSSIYFYSNVFGNLQKNKRLNFFFLDVNTCELQLLVTFLKIFIYISLFLRDWCTSNGLQQNAQRSVICGLEDIAYSIITTGYFTHMI